ncbi:sensor histidine kinase [Fimbriiglobus ruber]|uniref:histidine kinase n=1 Tax=Fimbriiglobus ruber TaxID=1908690 RepID=A0A225DZS2_9BACT|nr:HAMP domain-containing sensor histidine kinase [Fimbriiglobus ruber]OWK41617.1 sensor histidine kinase [Fimbriiglobus ruber]
MTLTGRLITFFLTGLAVVLVGFSGTLYLLARGHLARQRDDRLRATLDTLAASAELEPGGVEWEPHGRPPSSRPRDDEGAIRWAVTGPGGKILDRSTDPPEYAGLHVFDADTARPFWYDDPDGRRWRVGERRIDDRAPEQVSKEPSEKFHKYLILTAAVSGEPTEAVLTRLAAVLTGTSVVVWLVSLVGGRWVCRSALRPVTRMAADARAMTADDFTGRLPVPKTEDELAELGSAFNGLLDRVREAYERQRQFAGNASHQFRTPLAALLGQVEVCLRHPREPGEYQRVLSIALAQGRHLRQILDALLYLSRADADAAVTDLAPLDLARWAEDHLKDWAGHPRGADVRFEYAAVSPATIRAHAPLLGQLLDNLLDNACKYSQPGTPVVVRVLPGNGEVVLTVEDRGVGISPGDLARVFDPFFRSEAARTTGRPGVGLGLTIAQRICTLLGGRLTAESEPGVGSRFAVTFPLVPPLPPADIPPVTG